MFDCPDRCIRFLEQLGRGRLWARLWLRPEAWPASRADLPIVSHRLTAG